ncbi:DNA-binding transcriptional regulator, ArsR family [Rhizobiales bacterium GAS191]|nr:DNA-binding transcriptional regulator, ArsR family [Rhizobiales bacterium GAS113]SEE83826.1 DNA-binding transcriptional regulator, ArsR family [Rhizobiales bacterium GAS191]
MTQSGRLNQTEAHRLATGLDRHQGIDYLTVKLINQMAYYSMSPDRLSSTFAALADPTRRAILARLALGETSVTELAEPFEMSLPGISKHLKVLERAGLITRSREAQWRPCRLEAGPLKDIADWVEAYRRFWDESFERLDSYLRELKTTEKKHARKPKS